MEEEQEEEGGKGRGKETGSKEKGVGQKRKLSEVKDTVVPAKTRKGRVTRQTTLAG